jgi:F-type H+-transporting ATPase subunit c
MEIAAAVAAFAVVGPAIALGILTGMSVSAIGRNPEAAPQIRATFIIGAAFTEGLGVLTIVVGILAILLGGPG